MVPRNHRTFSASWPGPFVVRAVIIISMAGTSRNNYSLKSKGDHPPRPRIHPQTIQRGGFAVKLFPGQKQQEPTPFIQFLFHSFSPPYTHPLSLTKPSFLVA